MLNLKINKRIFNDVYFPYLYDYSHRFLVLYGSAGSGKSIFAVQRMIIKALKGKRKILFIRKVAATLKDSIFNEVINILTQFQLISMCKINNTNYTIELPNGSIFLFKGLDNSEKIKSIAGITDIVIEEATELTEDDFTQLNLRLRSAAVSEQEIVMMFNPISKANWCYKHWFLNKPDNALVIKTTYKDNKFLPQEYIDSLLDLARRNESYYKIYALGDFATLDKLIFQNFQIQNIKEQLLNKKKVVGVDFGYSNDPTTGIEVYYDKESKTIYITDEFYGKGMLTKQIADTITEKGFNNYMITADCADPRLIAELRNMHINIQAAKKGKDSILHGIAWLQANTIIIDSSCAHTIEEFQNYTWEKDKSTNEYYNTPIDGWNHCIDALRYAVEQYSTGSSVRAFNKAALGI